jgi:endonuclease YncB( thermonuclease family)
MTKHIRRRKKSEPHWTWDRILTVLAVIAFVTWALVTAFHDARGHEVVNDNAPRPIPAPDPGVSLDARVTHIVDGDTIDCTVLIPLVFRIRLIDCWAAETRTKDLDEKKRGLAAKAYLKQLIGQEPVRVHIPGRAKLGDMLTLDRVLGRVWPMQDGKPLTGDLSSRMVGAGHATPTKKELQQ